MHALLREWKASRPLAGAAFYMAAPYHLLDFARRGAFAEFTAITLLPFVALALPRAAEGRPAALALAYSALIFAHLPLALLTSLFLLPVLLDYGGGRGAILRVIGTASIGAGRAAAYWIPALALQRFTAMAAMHAATLQRPAGWNPASFWGGAVPAHLFLLAIGVALAVAAVALTLRRPDCWRWQVLAMLALAFGLARPIWLLPGLDRVQFPWRVLPLAEFGVAMLAARVRLAGPMLLAALAPALLMSSLALAPSLLAIGRPEPRAEIAALMRYHPDVPEYLPSQYKRERTAVSDRALALARRTPWAREGNGVTTLHRFAFPIWQADCPSGRQATTASPEGLIRLPSGCSLVRVRTAAERAGIALSLSSLLLLGALVRRQRACLLPHPTGRLV